MPRLNDVLAGPRPQFTIRDGIIVVAGYAIHWSLPAYGYINLRSILGQWSGRGWVDFLRLLIVGPTLVGPLLIWLHRNEQGDRKLLSGKYLWLLLSYLKIAQLLVFYWFLTRPRDRRFGGPPPPPWQIDLKLMCLFGFTASITTFIVIIRMRWHRKSWLDWTGICLGVLWSVYTDFSIYNYLIRDGLGGMDPL